MNLSELMELEVVTATGTKMKLRETPSAVYIISEKDIHARGYRTLIDALQDIPGFDIQHTYGLFPDLVHQRGLIGNNQRSLVYIDGILDNNISENAFVDDLFFQLMIRNILDADDAFDAGIRTATGAYYPTQQPIEGRNMWLTVGHEF